MGRVRFIWLAAAFGFTCCRGRSDISDVQSSVLPIDKSITLGDAFAHYPYFRTTRWKVAAENGRHFVDVVTTFDWNRIAPDLRKSAPADASASELDKELRQIGTEVSRVELTFRFVINRDKTVELYSARETPSVVDEPAKGSPRPATRSLTSGNARWLLVIYQDKLPAFLWGGAVSPP